MDTPKPPALLSADALKPPIPYPESDGEPLGETDSHITVILHLLEALRYFFRQEKRIYVAANMLFYYEEGDPTAVKAPDVFVVKGVAKHQRRTYKLWEEKKAPCVVLEITSRQSRLEDQGTKRALYEMLGVREYFLFDPLDEYLSPRLQGLHLVGGSFKAMSASAQGTLRSKELGLILRPEGKQLRLVDPRKGQALPTLEEAAELAQAQFQRAKKESRRAAREAQRADAAEAELARLRGEQKRRRKRSRE